MDISLKKTLLLSPKHIDLTEFSVIWWKNKQKTLLPCGTFVLYFAYVPSTKFHWYKRSKILLFVSNFHLLTPVKNSWLFDSIRSPFKCKKFSLQHSGSQASALSPFMHDTHYDCCHKVLCHNCGKAACPARLSYPKLTLDKITLLNSFPFKRSKTKYVPVHDFLKNKKLIQHSLYFNVMIRPNTTLSRSDRILWTLYCRPLDLNFEDTQL
jgi:hypothetical protein